MEGSPLLSTVGLEQPPSVDFIKNQLPQIHDAFKDLPVHYDPGMGRFVLDPHAAAVPPPRKLVPALQAMTFWNQILDDAMEKFKTDNLQVPKRLVKKPEYNIRDLKTWDMIHGKLQVAREKFDGEKSGFWGRVKKTYRHLIDQNDVVQQVLKAVPDMEYVSPVKAAVEVLLDAAKTTSIVRQKALSSFVEKDLEKVFGKIEVFLATFPKDENVKLASIDLIASTLKAIEGTIEYFLSHTLDRFRGAFPVVGDGNKFQEDLLCSIGQISVKCRELEDQALHSHIAGTKEAMEKAQKGIEQVILLEVQTGSRVEVVIEMNAIILERQGHLSFKVDQLRDEVKDSFQGLSNYVLEMFEQGRKYLEDKERAVEERERKFMEEQRAMLERRAEGYPVSEIRIYGAEGDKAIEAMSNPTPQQAHWLPQQHLPWFQLPQYSGQFQHVPANGYPQQQGWLPLPGMPPTSMGYYHQQPPPEPAMHLSALTEILNMPNLDMDDLASIMESAESIDLRYRSQARRIISTDEFHAWAASPTSCELLIQGDPGKDVAQASSALSLVSASLMNGLRNREGFVSLVFFCGNHIESDDMFTGPHAMIRSLIAQLLRQQFAEFTFRQQDVDLDGLRAGDFDVLCRLFRWLVRQILQHKTLVCVVDAVEAYETSNYESSMREVVQLLLDLTRDPSLVPVVKVLATSPEGTVSLDELFTRDESSVLLIEGLLSRGNEEDALDLEQMR